MGPGEKKGTSPRDRESARMTPAAPRTKLNQELNVLMEILGLRGQLPQKIWGKKGCREKLKKQSQREREKINLHVTQKGRQ